MFLEAAQDTTSHLKGAVTRCHCWWHLIVVRNREKIVSEPESLVQKLLS